MADKKTGSATTVDKKEKKPVVEDEEFEEFPVQEWAERGNEADEDVNVWEDNWDDETHESEFSKQLKEELVRAGHKN